MRRATAGAQAAPQPGRAVETETIIVPPGDLGIGDPGLGQPDPDVLEEEVPSGEEDTADPAPAAGEATEPPEVHYDTDNLPPPVRRLREQIIDAALTGDIEKLRPVFEANEGPPAISSAEGGDPIDELRPPDHLQRFGVDRGRRGIDHDGGGQDGEHEQCGDGQPACAEGWECTGAGDGVSVCSAPDEGGCSAGGDRGAPRVVLLAALAGLLAVRRRRWGAWTA